MWKFHRIRSGKAAHFDAHGSMHRRANAVVGSPRRAVTLGAQLFKDGHHCGLGRVHEGPAGDVLGVLQKLFGFGDFVHAATVPERVFSGIPFHLNSVEAS